MYVLSVSDSVFRHVCIRYNTIVRMIRLLEDTLCSQTSVHSQHFVKLTRRCVWHFAGFFVSAAPSGTIRLERRDKDRKNGS